jgi:outer membrane receptor for ferrienterochelin and colicin
MIAVITMLFALEMQAQESSPIQPNIPQDKQSRAFQTKPTRKQILAMKFEELSALSLEELTELSSIIGVSSVDELLKLLVNTASKSDETLNDAPGVISVITAREIELFGARTLTDVLNYVVSVQLYAAPLFQNNFTMRGDLFRSLTSKHVLILINGRPVRESLFAGIYAQVLNGFPLASIERVEVLRGPGSVLYGTNAFTGTVNIITKTSNGASVSARGGSFGTLSASAEAGTSFTTPLGEARFDAGVQYNDVASWTLPFRLPPQGGRPPQEIQYNPFQRSLSGMVSASVGGLKAQVFVTDYRASTFGPAIARAPFVLTNFTLNADLSYTHTFSDALQATLSGTLNRYDTRHVEQLFSNDGLLELTVNYRPTTKFNILIGGLLHSRYGIQTFTSNASVIVPEYNQLWWSMYAEAHWQPFENLRLTAGAQINKAVNINADISPRFAAIWNITSELGVKAFYGQAFRAAVGFENFSINPNGLGNPRLRPETNESLDAEIFWERENLRVAGVYFHTWQNNLIAPRNTAPPGQPQRNETQNFGSFQLEGLEFEAKYAPTNELYILGSVSYQTNLDGPSLRDVTMMPNWMVKTGIAYDTKNGIAASVFNIYNSKPNVLPPPTGAQPTPQINPAFGDYHLLSANVNLDITDLFDIAGVPHIIVNLRGENLLNATAVWMPDISRRINTVPLFAGRGFYAGISVKF